MKTVCEVNKCVGCMACMDVCPNMSIRIEDSLQAYNAIIREDKCVDCGACCQVCQNNGPVLVKAPVSWHQGWAKDSKIREKGSSGGLATAIAAAFIDGGGLVCSCYFERGIFGFKLARSAAALSHFSGSKYVKSSPRGMYKEMRDKLWDGEKILFIGIPCQVAALKKYVGDSLAKKLYTVDLICHGTPSPLLLEKFLLQYNYSLKTIINIKFRIKDKFQIYEGKKGIITTGVCDKFLIAFLNSMIYTENCYSCSYAKKERVSDITLGDSWGTELTAEEQKKGISLILCQTNKGQQLLEQSNLHLEPVDLDQAIKHNHQLNHPAKRPANRNRFFAGISKGKCFNALVLRYFPRQCFHQNMKEMLIKARLRRG